MRWGEQITLVALSEPSPRTNEHGFPVARTETATTVFADKKSVGFSEFYKAQQAGYTTELKFDVHSFEYEEQQIVISIHALLAESDSKSAQNSGALLRI